MNLKVDVMMPKVTDAAILNAGCALRNITSPIFDVNEWYEKVVETTVERLKDFISLESGWKFESIKKLALYIDKSNPISASSYIYTAL